MKLETKGQRHERMNHIVEYGSTIGCECVLSFDMAQIKRSQHPFCSPTATLCRHELHIGRHLSPQQKETANMDIYINIFETSGDDDAGAYDLKLGSDRRAINAAASHFGFFMFNFINVSYLLFIEGYALRNIDRGSGKNFLHLLCLIGCAYQICSCITSMTRLNLNDEFNSFWANGGTIFGNMGFALCNSAVSVV
jgi:hypothetical protein